ncbi:MAG: hypothetical protein J6I84_04275 [Bacilli bacterium]|nr:hypothetical protein [Bacilli bacterium]
MIQEEYVSFEIAKLLKEKGFNCLCPAYYSEFFDNWKTLRFWKCGKPKTYDTVRNNGYLLVPTQSVVMKWLREVHKIHLDIGITLTSTEDPVNYPPKYYVYVESVETGESLIRYGSNANDLTIPNGNGPRSFDTYEEAVETGINYCLENLT